jgi:hypothetical protein
MTETTFKVGDIIISKKGTKPGEITHLEPWRRWQYEVKYIHNGRIGYISKENAILYHGDTTMTQNTIYSFNKEDGKLAYATYLATNSSGEWVVEEMGSRAIHTKPKDSFTEVVPFTFSAKAANSTLHFTCEEGKVKKGDILMNNGMVLEVTELNTKSRTAPKFTGKRLVTESF